MSDNVVHLNFKGSNCEEDMLSMMSCSVCHNKTFVVVYIGEEFPVMKCAACGSHTGKIGWANND